MLDSIEDPEIKISLNKEKLSRVKESSREELPQRFFEEIRVGDVGWLAERRAILGDVPLHELLSGCDISLPRPVEVKRSAQLEERILKLKQEQHEREYRDMTKNVDNVRVRHPEDTIAFQMKQINRQLIAVLQFVVSVVAGFAFGFLGVELVVGNLDVGFRLLLGVICALVIALAEIYFLAKKLAEDDYPPPPPVPASPPLGHAASPPLKQHLD
ncbi:uncharacterized protein LOC111055784 isoform X2 [Nilaparvata lugens]|uniref:uncharacterized protein LOC111055784 isoform X2 n=1 Tax=Nilaparvata lugens TaxID=108931 RepID=UPI00193D5C01|nr:uncharacterized protein LOC111055784 isoform X2 [Nilaparvata lugens]XP_039275574.1 uncharacterized protein LOC111055784 isoform X2 [Nilaparvata lugens]